MSLKSSFNANVAKLQSQKRVTLSKAVTFEMFLWRCDGLGLILQLCEFGAVSLNWNL